MKKALNAHSMVLFTHVTSCTYEIFIPISPKVVEGSIVSNYTLLFLTARYQVLNVMKRWQHNMI